MVQGKINRGRHSDHPAGRHSIQTPCSPVVITWAPCAVEHDVRSGRASFGVSAGARLPTKRIISNNSYAHDQGDNPGQETGLNGFLYKL